MLESAEPAVETSTSRAAAVKDKACPYCHQAFTSSSLGRHLDLYIRDRNPKQPDGVHDVEAIRRLRGAITRRQARTSLTSNSKPSSTPPTTSRDQVRLETPSVENRPTKPSAIPGIGQFAVDSTLSKPQFVPSWEATGVNNIQAPVTPDAPQNRPSQSKRLPSTSRQTSLKSQLDVKQKLADALDNARAAELALREMISSWRAAKQHIDNSSMPFDYDPLSLDFPALTLQCLRPPPTLFSSTQHPTPTSWSTQSPGKREFHALRVHFRDEFAAWKVACASATTAAWDDLTYPPASDPRGNVRDAVQNAENAAKALESQLDEHLQSAYAAWEALPMPRQQELWVLELARSVGRKHKETQNMKEQQHRLQQENAGLRLQIDQLNRLQQPREYKLLSLTTSHGMSAQMSLDEVASSLANMCHFTPPQPYKMSQPAEHPPPQPSAMHQALAKDTTRVTSSMGSASEKTAPSTSNTESPSVQETSDQDADADMEDDDGFHAINISTATDTNSMLQPSPSLLGIRDAQAAARSAGARSPLRRSTAAPGR